MRQARMTRYRQGFLDVPREHGLRAKLGLGSQWRLALHANGEAFAVRTSPPPRDCKCHHSSG